MTKPTAPHDHIVYRFLPLAENTARKWYKLCQGEARGIDLDEVLAEARSLLPSIAQTYRRERGSVVAVVKPAVWRHLERKFGATLRGDTERLCEEAPEGEQEASQERQLLAARVRAWANTPERRQLLEARVTPASRYRRHAIGSYSPSCGLIWKRPSGPRVCGALAELPATSDCPRGTCAVCASLVSCPQCETADGAYAAAMLMPTAGARSRMHWRPAPRCEQLQPRAERARAPRGGCPRRQAAELAARFRCTTKPSYWPLSLMRRGPRILGGAGCPACARWHGMPVAIPRLFAGSTRMPARPKVGLVVPLLSSLGDVAFLCTE